MLDGERVQREGRQVLNVATLMKGEGATAIVRATRGEGREEADRPTDGAQRRESVLLSGTKSRASAAVRRARGLVPCVRQTCSHMSHARTSKISRVFALIPKKMVSSTVLDRCRNRQAP